MVSAIRFVLALAALLTLIMQPAYASGTLHARSKGPVVKCPAGVIRGRVGKAVETFSGIPFARPPTRQRRLRRPVRLKTKLKNFDATGKAPGCPQLLLPKTATSRVMEFVTDRFSIPFLETVKGQENCLTLTIQRPAGTKRNARLPVLFWIFGGGFQFGSAAMYDASSLLNSGVDMGQPFIFVGVNYRLGGFGFLPGSQVRKAGVANLGLLDQRMGLQWVADNIAAFGGNPGRVTIWGESAGAISVLDQMVMFNGNNKYKGRPLFHAAIMNSGGVVPARAVDSKQAQSVYNRVVSEAGCASARNTLNCLRSISYNKFLRATSVVPSIFSYTSLALSYLPRPDGRVLTASPERLIATGKYAAVPMITGNQEDEGTLFALYQRNITSSGRIVRYLKETYFPDATLGTIAGLVKTYSAKSRHGSPFRSWNLNQLYTGYKRLAALLGDMVFTLTRRNFLIRAKARNPRVMAWSYLASNFRGVPVLGTFHGSDLLQFFFGMRPDHAGKAFRAYYINFVYTKNPNKGKGKVNGKRPTLWPEWGYSRKVAWFHRTRVNLLEDNFRKSSSDYLRKNERHFVI